MNFGSHLITFNEAGNVLIHDRIMDKKSNIVDLLQASVSVPEDVKPLDTQHSFKPCDK